MRFAIFALHVSKVLRLPGKSEAKSYEVLHLSCFVWQAQWILILHKRRGMFEEDLQRCMLRGRRRRSGR